MRLVKILFAALGISVALVIAAFVAVGLMIPAERSFTNEIEIGAPIEKVWQVVTDKSKYTEWQTNIARVEVTDDENWVEYPKNAPEPLRFTLAKDERPVSMAFDYKMGESFEGKWVGDMTKTPTGVRLKTVDSYAAKGWLTKILIYMFFDYDLYVFRLRQVRKRVER